jgi:hypothetical protein
LAEVACGFTRGAGVGADAEPFVGVLVPPAPLVGGRLDEKSGMDGFLRFDM